MSKNFSPFLVFFAAMLWATDGPFRLSVTEELPSFLIVFIEHAFSLIILIPFLITGIPKLKTLSKKSLLSLLIIGIGSSSLALIFFTESFHYLNPSAAILLQKLQPFIAIFLAYFLLQEKLSKYFWPLTILAVCGAYLVSFPTLIPRVFEGEVWNPQFLGISLAVGASILWGAGTVLGRLTLKELNWQDVTGLRFLFGFIFLGFWNVFSGDIEKITTITPTSWLFLFVMSIVSGAIGLLLYYRGLRDTNASVASIAELGFVVAAVLVNFVFIDAKLEPIQIIGMMIILVSIAGLSITSSSTNKA